MVTVGPEESARRAGPGDVAELARLVTAALDGVVGQRGADQWLSTAAPAAPGEADLAPDAPVAWFLGCLDDVPVGVAAVSEQAWRDGRTVLRAELVYVEPDARELGVGEALVDALLAEATQRGAAALESTALPGDRELKNLFERVGLVARAIVVHKALPTTAS